MISIVIPVYNSEYYLKETLDSVFDQTESDIEVIIVDDGSIDSSGEIAKSYENVKYFKKKNGGVASARNYGVAKSLGEYIAFIDADDLWAREKLSIQKNFLDKNDDIDMIYSDFSTFDEGGIISKNVSVAKNLPRVSGDIFFELILNCLFQTSTVMLRRSVWNEIGCFDESLTTGEDYDYWLRVADKKSISYCPGVFTKYRKHACSLTGKKNKNTYVVPPEITIIKNILNNSSRILGVEQQKKIKKRFSEILFSSGYISYYDGNFIYAYQYMKESLKEKIGFKSLYYCVIAKLRSF